VKAMLQVMITYTVAIDGNLAHDLLSVQVSKTPRRDRKVSRYALGVSVASVWLRCDYCCNDG